MDERDILRLEGVISIIFTVVACGQAAWIFWRARRLMATYAAYMNVAVMIDAIALTWIALYTPPLRHHWPETFGSHLVRLMPIATSMITFVFMHRAYRYYKVVRK